MKLHTTKELDTNTDIIILGLFEEDTHYYEDLDKELAAELKAAVKRKTFSTKSFGKAYATKISQGSSTRALIISLGKKKDFTLDMMRKAIAKGLKYTKARKSTSFATNLIAVTESLQFNTKELGRASAEGLFLANYKFDKYLSEDKDNPKVDVASISFQVNKEKEFTQGWEEGKVIAEATNLARDLINEPSMTATPSYLEKTAKDIAKLKNVSLKVLNKKDMEKLGMGAILGVTKGSNEDPKMIFLEYKGAPEKDGWTAILGKGITFDSGGYNLKPSGYMFDMKCDMSGAAVVLSTIKAIAQLGVKHNIVAVAPACENMIGANAYKPSDILKAYNKKSIEIGNTDAEGRLILADALSYTQAKYKPKIMIDFATLTGACVVALGESIAGLMSHDDKLANSLVKAGNESHDRVWRLPLLDDYKDAMKGSISDVRNIAPKGYGAGAITAGIFLSHFVETDKTRWAHVDIAGPAYIKEEKEYLAKGGAGAGVRLLSYYFM